MKALITGASGFLGGVLTRKLAKAGGELRALAREKSGLGTLEADGAKVVKGDLGDLGSLERAMQGVDVVFHLAGLRRAPERQPFITVNAEGTRNVAEAMLKAGAKRLVLASSLAVHGPSGAAHKHVETDPYLPEEWYGESKVEAEKIALSYADRLEVVIVRPPRIMGPGDKENLPFFKIVKRGLLLELAGPPRKLSLVDVEDCADAFVLAGNKKEAKGQAFLTPGPKDLTLEELQREVANALGVKTRRVLVPQVVLKSLASAADAVSKVTSANLPLNRKLAKQLLAPGWTCSGLKAHDVLGWVPKLGPSESIARTAKWYVEQGWL